MKNEKQPKYFKDQTETIFLINFKSQQEAASNFNL